MRRAPPDTPTYHHPPPFYDEMMRHTPRPESGQPSPPIRARDDCACFFCRRSFTDRRLLNKHIVAAHLPVRTTLDAEEITRAMVGP